MSICPLTDGRLLVQTVQPSHPALSVDVFNETKKRACPATGTLIIVMVISRGLHQTGT